MMTVLNILASLALFGYIGFHLVAYGRLCMQGGQRAHERADREGGSALLGKFFMEMGLWAIDRYVSWLVRRRVRPDTLSLLSLLWGFLAGLSFAYESFGFAAWFILLSGMFDIFDGAVARKLNMESQRGSIIDSILDRYVEFFAFAGLLIYYRDFWVVQLVCLTGFCGSFMITYSTAKAEALGVKPPRGFMKRAERMVYMLVAAALSPLFVACFENPVGGTAALAVPMIVALCIIAVFSHISALVRLFALAKH
jgi:phosphatidylglycerophosphate synthase